jgi:HEAT repeat protein
MHTGRFHILVLFLIAAIGAFAQEPESDPAKRARAVRDYGRGADSSAIPVLEKHLKDPAVEVRVEAVKAIVDIGTQRSLDPLVEATRDNDPEVQIRATDGLVNFYVPGYVRSGFSARLRRVGTSIQGRFSDKEPLVVEYYVAEQVRPEIVEALGRLASGGAGLDVRANAARAIGILRGKAAIPQLLKAMRTKDSVVIYEALIALQKIAEPGSGADVAFLVRDLDKRVQLTAIETVGLLRTPEAIESLRDVFGRTKDRDVRRAAIAAIAMAPDESCRPLFEENLTDRDEEVRAAAAEGLGRLGSANDLARLEQAFQNERRMKPRLSMAFAVVKLGKLDTGQFSALTYLVNTLNSASYKGIAQPLLVELCRNPEVRGKLYPGMAGWSKDERIGIASVLAASGGKDSEATLQSLSMDPDPAVAQEGTRALRTLRARIQ